MFSNIRCGAWLAAGCLAALLSAPCAGASTLYGARLSERTGAPLASNSADYAYAVYVEPAANAYVELLDLQILAIDDAAAAIEAAHEQNTRLALVLEVVAAALGAICAWLMITNLAERFIGTPPKRHWRGQH